MHLSMLGDLLRIIFVSWEFVVALATTILFFGYPSPLALLGIKVLADGDGDLTKYSLALPGLILVWALAEGKRILAPASAGQNAQLRAWPKYWRLKSRVLIALGWIVLTVATALATWVFRNELPSALGGAFLVASILISGLSAGSLWVAHVTVREIVER